MDGAMHSPGEATKDLSQKQAFNIHFGDRALEAIVNKKKNTVVFQWTTSISTGWMPAACKHL